MSGRKPESATSVPVGVYPAACGLPAEELRHRFEAEGIDFNKPVVSSCGSGVSACLLAFGLHLLGKDDVSVYDGSWADWGLPGDTPVATGKG